MYRENVYGAPPTYYCDPTRSLASNGDGSEGDPWNLTQAAANAVAGDIVGLMETGSSGVQMAAPNSDQVAAFSPSNSGSSGSPIVFVTKFAAIALDSVETNANRTELRHAGSAPGISGGVGTGTGGPCVGAYHVDYITYDGLYFDMTTAYISEDSGLFRPEVCTGFKFLNFVVKGATLTIASNPIMYRPQDATDSLISNFRAYDFVNDGTGSATPQTALFSDQYGDQNFTIQFFEIYNIARGPFVKGSGFVDYGSVLNYGTIQYGIVRDCNQGIRVNGNAVHASNTVQLKYVLIYNYLNGGVVISNEGSPPVVRNVVLDHMTIAEGHADANQNGCVYMKSSAAGTSGVVLKNNILDVDSGVGANINFGENADTMQTLDYNGYYRGGGAGSWTWNGSSYSALATWQALTGTPDVHSSLLGTDPFNNRASDDFTIAAGHAALTASETSGQLGAFAGLYVPGVQV